MHRAAKALWCQALLCRRGRPWLARRVAAVAVLVVTGWAGAACSTGMYGPGAPGHGIPPVTVLTRGADNGNGDIFIAPMGAGGYASGPEILTTRARWSGSTPLPAGEFATDFRTQTYQGRPVLTWFQGSGARAEPTTSTTTATSGSPR